MTYTLVFDDSRGATREVAKIDAQMDNGTAKSEYEIMNDAIRIIDAIRTEHNHKIRYIRCWNQNGMTTFDVGSHTEFFHLHPKVDFNAN